MEPVPSAPLPDGVTIADLAECVVLTPALASLFKEAFLAQRDLVTTAMIEEQLRFALDESLVPRAWVVLAGERLIGGARLVAADHPDITDLTPWLGMVYVAPDWRRQGIATALTRLVQMAARTAGVPALYLHTRHHRHLYARLGFVYVRTIATPDHLSTCDLMVWSTGL